jgi:hypothetical protein
MWCDLPQFQVQWHMRASARNTPWPALGRSRRMLLQFCDSCGKPLSEGAIARGDAIERTSAHGESELICSVCIAAEQKAAAQAPEPAPEAKATTGPLGEYQQKVWNCEECGIPVNALDLIEGRASRVGGQLICSRCLPVSGRAGAAPTPAPKPTPRAAPQPAKPLPVKPRAMPSSTRPSQRAAESFIAAAGKEQRRPILPIVLFAIVLPMFGLSVYFAIMSQQKLNEVIAERERTEDIERDIESDMKARQDRERRADIPPLQINGNTNTNGTQPARPDTPPEDNEPAPEPERPRDTELRPQGIPADVAQELVQIERELAAPVITKLQSERISEVWEGLITAGSRRLVAARPHVRALLADKDDDTRVLACRVAGMLNDREALTTLSRMAEFDPDEQVRIEARQALNRMTGVASREVADMTEAELESLLRELQAELERRRGNHD